jgi:hypothetical protein
MTLTRLTSNMSMTPEKKYPITNPKQKYKILKTPHKLAV